MYSLIATAYHAVTGTVPSGLSGSVPQAQRLNHAISAEFDAILTKGLRAVANQRYQRPSELRQDLLALRSVSSTLVSSNNRNAAGNRASTQTVRSGPQAEPTQRSKTDFIPPLPIRLDKDDQQDEQVLLLPKPEELPVLKQRDDRL